MSRAANQRRLAIAVLPFFIFLALPTLARCEPPPPNPPPSNAQSAPEDVRAVVEELRSRVRRLEALVTVGGEEAKPAPVKETAPIAAPAESAGPETRLEPAPKPVAKIEVPDAKKWNVKLGGHVQMDYINWANASALNTAAQDYFEFRRLRLVADGTGYRVCDFRLQMSLEPETVGESPPGNVVSPDVKDAYFSMNQIPWFGRFRIGNFFVPFSLEQVTNDRFNVFLERSIPVTGGFAADREVGVAIYNCTENKRLTWAGGFFFDSISEALKERIDDNQGYRLSGRLTGLPYYDGCSNGRYLVHLGAGVLYTSDQDGRVRFRARPQIHEGPRLIDSGVIDAGSYLTGNLELAVVWGAVSLQSEAFVSAVNRQGGDVAARGAYAYLSWFLTGENRIFEPFGQHGAQFDGVRPRQNFLLLPGEVGWGAWEAKARWSCENLTDLDRGIYNDFTLGMNWYWSDRTRVMFDWIHPFTTAQTPFGTATQDILGVRFDYNW